MQTAESLVLGIVIERRESVSRWQRWVWRPVIVVPSAGPGGDWRMLRDDGRLGLFHAGQLPLRLYPDEAEAYLQNTGRAQPEVYVVLRGESERGSSSPVRPVLLTASPDEAAAYSEGEEAVHPVPMPPAVAAWVHRFAVTHHRPSPFVRRNRREREARTGGAAGAKGGVARRRPAWQIPGTS